MIAIRPEDGPAINTDSALNIADVATDVEEICLEYEKRRKKTRKHAPRKHTYATMYYQQLLHTKIQSL